MGETFPTGENKGTRSLTARLTNQPKVGFDIYSPLPSFHAVGGKGSRAVEEAVNPGKSPVLLPLKLKVQKGQGKRSKISGPTRNSPELQCENARPNIHNERRDQKGAGKKGWDARVKRIKGLRWNPWCSVGDDGRGYRRNASGSWS